MPARNEENHIRNVLQKVGNRVDAVLVVDDNSEDSTGRIATEQGCLILRNRRHLGYGRTLRRGLIWCRNLNAEVAVTIDGDGQHEPEWINQALSVLDRGADVAFANRFASCEGVPNTKCLSNNFAWHCLKATIRRKPVCEDVACGFRAYNRAGLIAAINAPTAKAPGFAFTFSTCAHLHNSGLKLASFVVPAIYAEPVVGTPLGELRDFLAWLSEYSAMKAEGRRLLEKLARGQPITFDLEDWHTHKMVRVRGDHVEGYVRLSVMSADVKRP
jgi:glycosyltransferase involved in cell wall biosynthesis